MLLNAPLREVGASAAGQGAAHNSGVVNMEVRGFAARNGYVANGTCNFAFSRAYSVLTCGGIARGMY